MTQPAPADTYPAGPAACPPELTRPTGAYKRHAYLAVAGVLIFVVAYFALAGWFAWTSYRLLAALRHTPDESIVLILGGVASGFLAVFMFKAVVFVRRGQHDDVQVEVTAADHPRLFAFLHRLADEAKAPRPHRVFLSPRVNAAVFYDLSIANLILPSKKNLEIGLGLINVLTLAELKAVLAHELGHFAQRTMAVGRWVYIAQQIAGHIVVKRDALDRMLQWISVVDLRVAWIGWILRLIVWSIRSLVDTLFGWVVLAQRALGREMEFQADLVAVSLTGSDALVHALHRLDAADDALDRALAFTGGEERRGRKVADLFEIQTRMLERKRLILDDPSYGEVPPLPTSPAEHRVFEAQLAHPPRMWATHPPNELREANAKRVYVAAPLDDRRGWVLFDDPAAVRAEVTARLYASEAERPKPLEVVPIEDSVKKLDEGFDRRYFDPSYRGVYLGRSAMREAQAVDALYGPAPSPADLPTALEALYPASLAHDLARLRDLEQEKAVLEALRRGVLESPGRRVRFRGQDRRRKELPGMIADVERELAAARNAVADHDRRVRATHLAAAAALSPEWVAYLRGLAALVHYADHAEADLEDAGGALGNVLAVVMADRKVTDAERARVVRAATDLHLSLQSIHEQAKDVELGETVAGKLGVPSWKEGLGDFDLPEPFDHNLGDWLDVVQSWVAETSRALGALSSAALEELLHAEEQVALAVRAGQTGAAAPAAAPPPRVPRTYALLVPGRERPRQTKLGWWDRFQVADGFFPAAARFAVAGVIVGGVVLAGRALGGDATVYIYNGLARPVAVEIGGERTTVPGRSMATLEVAPGSHRVRARTAEGEVIESFTADAGEDYGKYAYNVAGAALLVEVAFRRDGGLPDQPRIPNARWHEVHADRVYADLPEEVEAKSSVESVRVLGRIDEPAYGLLSWTGDGPVRDRLAMSHARWEPADSYDLGLWLHAVPDDAVAEVIAGRLAANPEDVVTLAFEQDELGEAACTRHSAAAAAAPSSAEWQYLAARCEAEPAAQHRRQLELATRFPNSPWTAYGAAVAHEEEGRWNEATEGYERSHVRLPAMREAIAMRIARLRRLTAGLGANLSDLAAESRALTIYQMTEQEGAPPQPGIAAYWHLGRGALDQALGLAGDNDSLLVLIGASDGAPPAAIERALAVPTAKLGSTTAAVAFALAVRTGKDAGVYLARLVELRGRHAAPQRAFLESLQKDAKAAIAAADTTLAGCGAEERAEVYAAAAVLLGDACPPAWREHVRRVLFAAERPYLREPS